MRFGDKSPELNPMEFEEAVRNILRTAGANLDSFQTKHRERINAPDGSYEIDVTARFQLLGVQFLVLVECKKQKRPVEREVVQVLVDRVRAIGAHKGIIFSTGGFQSGAIQYAQHHGVALIAVAPSGMVYKTRDEGIEMRNVVLNLRKAERFSYWSCTVERGKETYSLLSERREDIVSALGVQVLEDEPGNSD